MNVSDEVLEAFKAAWNGAEEDADWDTKTKLGLEAAISLLLPDHEYRLADPNGFLPISSQQAELFQPQNGVVMQERWNTSWIEKSN